MLIAKVALLAAFVIVDAIVWAIALLTSGLIAILAYSVYLVLVALIVKVIRASDDREDLVRRYFRANT